MSSLCVTGYASLDYVLELSNAVLPDQTSHATRVPDAWPRLGGCPTYIAMAAAQSGGAATPIIWVGADPLGAQFLSALARTNVNLDGVSTVVGGTSPTAVMLYQPDGSCACVYDPGLAGQENLNTAQEGAIAMASHLCITVGPPHLTARIMALRSPTARLYWAVKNDPVCFTPKICVQLGQSADVIFCNAAERAMIGSTPAVVVQTLGASGVEIEENGTCLTLPVNAINTRDTTGAGDSFAGGYIGAEMAGVSTAKEAALFGIETAGRLLRNRKSEGRT
jgi:sugar/nucleoside kinase (ribokinase family)